MQSILLENCFAQTFAVSVGSGAVAVGFVGPLLALELHNDFIPKLSEVSDHTRMGFGCAVALLGVCLSVPLREVLLVKDWLPFPSGMAAAQIVHSLHAPKDEDDADATKCDHSD